MNRFGIPRQPDSGERQKKRVATMNRDAEQNGKGNETSAPVLIADTPVVSLAA